MVLPDWPVLMGVDLACAYTQLGEDSFRFLARKRGVKPVDCEGLGVTRWRRADLDRLVDSLPHRGAEMAATAPSANDADDDSAAQRALEKARRRIR